MCKKFFEMLNIIWILTMIILLSKINGNVFEKQSEKKFFSEFFTKGDFDDEIKSATEDDLDKLDGYINDTDFLYTNKNSLGSREMYYKRAIYDEFKYYNVGVLMASKLGT